MCLLAISFLCMEAFSPLTYLVMVQNAKRTRTSSLTIGEGKRPQCVLVTLLNPDKHIMADEPMHVLFSMTISLLKTDGEPQ